jgi:hypothetical protein
VDDVVSVLFDNNVDLACVSETWFSSQSNTTTSILRNSGYNIVHNFREKRGGGVGIIWNSRLNSKVRSSSTIRSFTTFQYQNIIFNGKYKINLMCLYRLQETSYSQFLEELDSLLSDQDPRYPLVLTGDFNVHFQKSNLQNVKDLADLTSSFGLKQFVIGPTNIFGNTIDLLFANCLIFEMNEFKPTGYSLSDHFPIFFDLPDNSGTKLPIKKSITYRDTKSVDVPSFASNLSSSLSLALAGKVDNSSFCELLNIYNNTVGSELNVVAPWKTRTFPSSDSPPWMDAEYRSGRATRRGLERQWKKSSLPKDKKLYVAQRDLCVNMSKDKRSKYYKDLIEGKRGDQRQLETFLLISIGYLLNKELFSNYWF